MKKGLVILFTLSSVLAFTLGVMADPTPDPGPFDKVTAPVVATTLIPK